MADWEGTGGLKGHGYAGSNPAPSAREKRESMENENKDDFTRGYDDGYAYAMNKGHAKGPAGEQPALYSALAKAQALLKAVEKDGTYSADLKNKEGKKTGYKVTYNYASAEAVMGAATEAMGQCGLALVCTTWALANTTLRASYLLTHEAGGSMVLGPFDMSIHENKMKPRDKATATGLTYLQNYATRGIFNIPRVEPGTERDSQNDADIQAWESEQQALRKKREDDARKEHAAKQKTLKAKGERVNENAPEFFKAAAVEWCKENKIKFMVWAGCVEEWPGRTDVDKQIQVVDESLQYLMEWKQMDEIEALHEANTFSVIINGEPDPEKKAEDAFEASLEGNLPNR